MSKHVSLILLVLCLGVQQSSGQESLKPPAPDNPAIRGTLFEQLDFDNDGRIDVESLGRSIGGWGLVVGSGDDMSDFFSSFLFVGGGRTMPFSIYWHLAGKVKNPNGEVEKALNELSGKIELVVPLVIGPKIITGTGKDAITSPAVATIPEFFPSATRFREGRNFRLNGDSNEAVVGAIAAKSHGLKLGQSFQLTNGPNTFSTDFKIVGILEPKNLPQDKAFFVSLADLYKIPELLIEEDFGSAGHGRGHPLKASLDQRLFPMQKIDDRSFGDQPMWRLEITHVLVRFPEDDEDFGLLLEFFATSRFAELLPNQNIIEPITAFLELTSHDSSTMEAMTLLSRLAHSTSGKIEFEPALNPGKKTERNKKEFRIK